jgi:hypothetical protein
MVFSKKNTHPDWVLVTTKEIPARNHKVSILVGEGGGGLRVAFDPWDFQNSQKEVSGNFESQTKFALRIEIYLPCEFHKLSLSHSLQTRENREGKMY